MSVGNENLIGIFTTDSAFIIRVWDAVLERMTGIPAENARHRSVVEIIPDLETRGLFGRFKRVMEEGTVEILAPAFHRFLISCPPPFPSHHFTEMRQRVTIAPLRENETIDGLIVTIEDVTERMEREIELAAQLRDADETVRLQTAKVLSNEPENLGAETAAPLINALGDKSWRVRRELVDGLARRAAPEAIAALLRAVKERHLDFGVLNSALKVLQSTSVKTTETLIEFLQGDDADLRMQAALSLGEQKDAQVIPRLLTALEDEDANVRYHVIEALAKLNAREAVDPLLEIAETRDFFLSFPALEALRQIADEKIVERLIPLLDDDFLSEAAVETLGAVGTPETAQALIKLLNKNREAAAGVAAALVTLWNRFETDAARAAKVIEKARDSINDDGKLNLLESLGNEKAAHQMAVIRVAGWFDDERIGEKLAALLDDEELRDEAVKALVAHGETAVDLLLERLNDDDLEVGRIAARALGNFKNERVVTALIEVLDADPELGSTAAKALGQIGDERAFEPLVDLLENGENSSRQAVVAALIAIAHPETVRRVGNLLADPAAPVRESAVRIVGHFGAKGFEEKIFECCRDNDERVRKAAVDQLPNIEDKRAVLMLIGILKEDSPRLRAAAAQNLLKIKNPQSLIALRESLTDTDSWVRYFAVRALGVWHDTESREILTEIARNDTAEHVRVAAHEVLNDLKA